jgi:hypothetical protein
VRLTLEVAGREGDEVVVRLVALNDTYKPVDLDRRLLIGPNLMVGDGIVPVSVEPRAAEDADNIVRLNPFCFYGRERKFRSADGARAHGYLVSAPTQALLPTGPADPGALAVEAESLDLAAP